jgi:hypothetical protein
MHRNTFRHRLREAEALLGDDPSDPDARLAVHVALRLRKLINGRGAVERRTLDLGEMRAALPVPSSGRRSVAPS